MSPLHYILLKLKVKLWKLTIFKLNTPSWSVTRRTLESGQSQILTHNFYAPGLIRNTSFLVCVCFFHIDFSWTLKNHRCFN